MRETSLYQDQMGRLNQPMHYFTFNSHRTLFFKYIVMYVPTVSFLFGNSVACETTRVVYSSLFDYIYVCTLILYHIYRPSDFLIACNLPIFLRVLKRTEC